MSVDPGKLSSFRSSWSPGGLFFRAIYGPMERLGGGMALRYSKLLSPLLALPLRGRRRANLERLFPGMTPEERNELDRRFVEFDTAHRVHFARLARLDAEELDATTVLHGLERLRGALEGGKGALIVGGHIATFLDLPVFLALRGFRVHVVLNPEIFPPVLRHIRRIAVRFGFRIAYSGEKAYGEVRKALDRNEILCLTMDVSVRPEKSLWLPFFGAALPVDPGPAVLALRRLPAVLWGSGYRGEDGMGVGELKLEPPYGRGTEIATPEAVLRRWLNLLEDTVKERPEQWWTLNFVALGGADRLEPAGAPAPAPK